MSLPWVTWFAIVSVPVASSTSPVLTSQMNACPSTPLEFELKVIALIKSPPVALIATLLSVNSENFASNTTISVAPDGFCSLTSKVTVASGEVVPPSKSKVMNEINWSASAAVI